MTTPRDHDNPRYAGAPNPVDPYAVFRDDMAAAVAEATPAGAPEKLGPVASPFGTRDLTGEGGET